jgi:membrane-bound ClpP family serine protease
MNLEDILQLIVNFASEDIQRFWIIVAIILVLLFFMFRKKSSNSSSVGMDNYKWQVFKRR